MVSTVELIDRFQALMVQECTTYRFDGYNSLSNHLKDTYVNANLSPDKKCWRIRSCGWMYHVVDHHSLDREFVYIAMNYVDRYLSKHSYADCESFQLAAMASLYMTIKIYRDRGSCADVASFVKLSKGLFTESDLLCMETSILDTLEWRVHPPTPQAYLELLTVLLPRGACSPFTKRAMFERIKFLLELSVTTQFFFGKRPSSIAAAAFVEVMEHDEGVNVPKLSRRAHFRYCARSIAGIDCDSEEVVVCRDAMRILHKSSLHQMNDAAMNEKERMESPTTAALDITAVTP
ncbi:hypothetical protein ACHAWF_016498 [Thalassiosira exigua]